ncbi:MAG: hypothetical protein LBU80_00765 [Rikenellaceae bacterium]|jgi:hypothetical protein|nr:hypothetical protein [Rikenellaceae bacterium]
MNLLISAREVIAIAFGPEDQIDDRVVNDFKIEAAQAKFIAPALGGLYFVCREVRYHDFLQHFVKPALAYFVKYGILPDLQLKAGNAGIVHNHTAQSASASDRQAVMLRREALNVGNTLLRKAIEHIEASPETFPEYDSDKRLHRRIFSGGIIL